MVTEGSVDWDSHLTSSTYLVRDAKFKEVS